jgi:hypothetical protein
VKESMDPTSMSADAMGVNPYLHPNQRELSIVQGIHV